MSEPNSKDTESALVGAKIRTVLSDTARTVEVGEADETLRAVRRVVRKRRRRRNALAGVAGAATLIASGVVVANLVDRSDNGDDLLVSAPDVEPDEVTGADSADVADAATSSATNSDAAPSNGADAAVAAPNDAAVAAPNDAVPAQTAGPKVAAETVSPNGTFAVGDFQQILAWKDGFLAVETHFQPQPLPALSEELVALFPPEVVQLFEDNGGLPATIEEATKLLQDAGLYDEVSQVVLDNPDVSAAIYEETPPPPVTSSRISSDGVDWEAVDIEFPIGADFGRQIVSTGERLVVTASGPVPSRPEPDAVADATVEPLDDARSTTVYSTTDLQTWTSQTIELPADDADVPDFIDEQSFVSSLAASHDRWVLSVESVRNVDGLALLPDGAEQDLLGSGNGYDVTSDETGIVIQAYGRDDSIEEIHFTWDELGLEPNPDLLADDGRGTSTIWAGSWNGQPAALVDTSAGGPRGEVVASDAGFFRRGDDLAYSVDGTVWTSFEPPVADVWSTSLMATPGGVVGLATEQDGSGQAFLLDVASLTWQPLDMPALPNGFSAWTVSSNPAMLYSVNEFGGEDFPVEPLDISITNETYELDASIERDLFSYALTDTATGEIVVSESNVEVSASEQPFEFLVENGDGSLTILSPETGEEITTFTSDQVDRSATDDDGATDSGELPPTSVVSGAEPVDEVALDASEEPDTYVLATNGESWINQRLDLPSSPDAGAQGGVMMFANHAVANDDVVLVSVSDGSLIRLQF